MGDDAPANADNRHACHDRRQHAREGKEGTPLGVSRLPLEGIIALGARHVPDSDTCTADEWSHGLAYFDVAPAVPRIRLHSDRR
ncbi:hypothetical protein CLV65_1559 [Pseudoscardovia suis]|uniref:Uncharacterized protein n=1 Tax=Pseudoscardovia suis TaxID=987063 RepID=A0A261EPV0_9BIFI|nr:hypothetical protein PSSU_1704 [Pseudoscardovia suis]PJJ63936.1 hypothetical protein CLV65_1559 [Pseudoscardovia suis]